MAPKRFDKGKRKVEYCDEIDRSPKLSLAGQRVAFSKKIAALVTPSRAVDNFESLFKVSRKTFNYIRSIVSQPMMSEDSDYIFLDGRLMSLNDKIAIALKRLSSVDSLINTASLFTTNQSTVDEVTWRFVEALEAGALHHISWPSETAHMKQGFARLGDMPNCCGALESTHLKMYQNDNEGKLNVWLDRQNNTSMILQVIVDPKMRFIDVVTGWPGIMTKNNVLESTEFYRLAQNGERLNGCEIKLSKRTKLREYLIGGSGFQLLPWLITPYHNEPLTEERLDFNQKHLATRLVAHRALKKLKDEWAVIDGSIWKINRHKLPRIILACCILHNIQLDMEGDGVSDESTMSCEHDPGYPQETSVLANEEALLVRDKLCLYLAGKHTV